MDLQEYMMTVVSEEAGEITQAVSKLLRFGKDSFHPDKPEETNEYTLLKEFYQLQAMIEHLQQEGMLKTLPNDEIASIKLKKLENVYHYMAGSNTTVIDLGKLEERFGCKINMEDLRRAAEQSPPGTLENLIRVYNTEDSRTKQTETLLRYCEEVNQKKVEGYAGECIPIV